MMFKTVFTSAAVVLGSSPEQRSSVVHRDAPSPARLS
jgi:hypothetical protein